jgi:hypothetical protein
VVVKHEAQAIRRSRQKLVASDDVDLDAHEARSLPTPDEQVAALDLVGRAAEALQRLKPHEIRALWLKAEGHSYNEIAEITGWTYTKVNRCLSEGRSSFLSRYATIESGAECERWLPVISAMVDGETTPDQLMELRPHLRNCPGCRATLGALRGSSKPLSMVLPIPLLAVGAGRGEGVTHSLSRLFEMIAGGVHDRAAPAIIKAQALIEATTAGKAAAIAGAAAAVAGGGYATVERSITSLNGHRPAKVHTALDRAATQSAQKSVGSAPVIAAHRVRATRSAQPGSEFSAVSGRRQRKIAPEFGGGVERASAAQSSKPTAGPSTQERRSNDRELRAPAPEFVSSSASSHSPEFGP